MFVIKDLVACRCYILLCQNFVCFSDLFIVVKAMKEGHACYEISFSEYLFFQHIYTGLYSNNDEKN
jgi:hypothetical protein